MNLVFLDTNILIYRRDPRHQEKQRIAYAWIAALGKQFRGRLSWQVLQEFYSVATRKLAALGLDPQLAQSDVRLLSRWQPAEPDLLLCESAWSLADRYGFAWWDALIVAAALRQECTLLLSEDLQHNLVVDGRLTIINPFAPDAPLPPDAS
ncbi:MAG: PIN domain-containing protein [Rhodocyclaceae bacterium]|nr:PIN domain-containing protein [Rhodocyclaceae bacterium]